MNPPPPASLLLFLLEHMVTLVSHLDWVHIVIIVRESGGVGVIREAFVAVGETVHVVQDEEVAMHCFVGVSLLGLAFVVLRGLLEVDELGTVTFLLLGYFLLAAGKVLVQGHDGEVVVVLLALAIESSLSLLVCLGLADTLVVVQREGINASDIVRVNGPSPSVDPLVVSLLLVSSHVMHRRLYLLR